MDEKLISIIVPCYNEEKTVSLFMDEISKVESQMKDESNVNFEYIFIDDGSKDATASILRDFSKK